VLVLLRFEVKADNGSCKDDETCGVDADYILNDVRLSPRRITLDDKLIRFQLNTFRNKVSHQFNNELSCNLTKLITEFSVDS
jgi:hypothetical protein